MIRLLLALGTALTIGSTGAAQDHPDFSGTWKLDEARSVSPTYDGFIGPVTWVITHTPAALVVDITRGPRTFTLTFAIRAPSPASAAKPDAATYRASWEGDRLITESTQEIQGQTVMTKSALSLQAGGRELIVDRIVQVEHGYTLRGARSYGSGKDTFVKQ